MIANNLVATSPTDVMRINYTALGDSATAVANGDVALGNEVYRKTTASYTNAANVAYVTAFYTADEDAIFKRGYFNFYSRRSKKWLYLKGKRDLNYSCVKSDFGRIPGRFHKFYPINEEEYRKRMGDVYRNFYFSVLEKAEELAKPSQAGLLL